MGAILLTANGKAFCAGMDLAEIAQAAHAEEIDAVHEQLFTIGARLAKPLVAGVHGAALGGGTGLVANCHIVVAGPEASFGLTEIRLGLWPFLVYRAVAGALGERRTLELSLTGRIFGPGEARDLGLAHEVAEDAPDRAGENRPGGGRIQSGGCPNRDGLCPKGEGARLAGGRRHRSRGAESGVCRGGFPRGDSRLPGEAEPAVALDWGGKGMKASGLREECLQEWGRPRGHPA